MNEIKELRKPAKRRGATRMIISGFKRNIYFIDLIDFYSKQHKWIQEVLGSQKSTGFHKNRGYKYVLVCIDGYSKYLMARRIIQTYGESPKHICSDRGTEFTNAIFRTNILNKYDITMYHMDSANKAVLAERTIRDIKEHIMVPFNQWKGVWFDLIDGAVRRHNGRKNRDIGYTPNDIWLNNNNNYILYTEKTEPSNMTANNTTPQFDVGDYVGVTRRPRILEKRSLTSKWSQDLVEVVDIDDHIMPLMYEVKNVKSDSTQKCYDWELLASKCKPQPAPPITRSKSGKEPNALRGQQGHIDPLRSYRRRRNRRNNNNLAQVFENDRDVLHTSQTYKRRDIRECRDHMTLTCLFYSIYQFDMGKGHKIVEYNDEWHIEQLHTIH